MDITEVDFLKNHFLEIDSQFNYWKQAEHENSQQVKEVA
jgi:hypothetical protein